MALLPTEDNLTNASTTNAQQKTNFANLRNFLADLLGTDSSNKVAARAALGVAAPGDAIVEVVFEGATADAFQTTLSAVDPTADNSLLLPNKSGTLATLDDTSAFKEIQPFSVAMSSNAATLTLNPTTLDFRSNTAGSGVVNTRKIASPITTVISAGSTGGTTNGAASRILVLAIDNAGTVELAWVNQSCGINLDESKLISTTAEGGSGSADSATVIYSTAARTNVPFRVVGFFDSNQTTAGTWASPASLVQGAGGGSLRNIDTRIWQNVTRALNTDYVNTTGGDIEVNAVVTASGAGISVSPVVAGFTLPVSNPVNAASFQQSQLSFTVKDKEKYQITASGGATVAWAEKRYT
jgi:hypothetical protein